VGKKLKQSKKNDDVSFLPTELPTEFIPSVILLVKIWTLFIMSITKGITDGIVRRYFPESSRTVHFPIALLIVVLYGQNHRRIEKSSVLFDGFLKHHICKKHHQGMSSSSYSSLYVKNIISYLFISLLFSPHLLLFSSMLGYVFLFFLLLSS